MSNNELILSLREKISVVPNLQEVRGHLRAEAAIAQEQLALEEKRHREAVSLIAERFEVECWRTVKSEWSTEEIEAAVSVEET